MEKLPRYFAFAITDRCQSHCATCNGWQSPSEYKYEELSTNDWKFVLSSLQQWLGTFDFIFTGGEPFLREDLLEIANYAAEIGLQPKVITNGLALKNKCEDVIKSGFTDITISLNAVKNPKIHNDSRGRKDAFKITSDVIQNLSYLNRKYNAGKTILIAAVIMSSNLTEMVPLAEFAHQNGIGINYQLLDGGNSFFTAHNVQQESLKMFDEMKQQTVDAINKLIDLKSQGYLIYNSNKQLLAFKDLIVNSETPDESELSFKTMIVEDIVPNIFDNKDRKVEDKINPDLIKKVINRPYAELHPDKAAVETEASCQIGHYNFLIDPYGSVRVCFSFDPIGSLITTLPQNIWNGMAAERIRSKIAMCGKSCKLLNCNYHDGDN